MKRVVIHIDRLVLNGFRPEDRHAIGEGLQQELSHLLTSPIAAQGITHLGDQAQLRAGRIHLAQSAKPQSSYGRNIGAQVAQSINKEFTK